MKENSREENIKILEEMVEKSRDLREEDFYKLIGIKQIQAIATFIKVYKEIEEENKTLNERNQYLVKYRAKLEKELYESNDKYIPISLVEEKFKKEKLPNIIVGGRRNTKTLEYGKKLGRIEICEELLENKY